MAGSLKWISGKFFDNLDHGHLREFLRLRVREGVLLRLIDKWLKAGVMEDGSVSYPDAGTPQGGVVSPILSNVFLHYLRARSMVRTGREAAHASPGLPDPLRG
jgi:retron-type reverse transcriptase